MVGENQPNGQNAVVIILIPVLIAIVGGMQLHWNQLHHLVLVRVLKETLALLISSLLTHLIMLTGLDAPTLMTSCGMGLLTSVYMSGLR